MAKDVRAGWVRISVSGGRWAFVSTDGKWRVHEMRVGGAWTLTDRVSGYRRHFGTCWEAMTFAEGRRG